MDEFENILNQSISKLSVFSDLPSNFKDLLLKHRRIKSLYGKLHALVILSQSLTTKLYYFRVAIPVLRNARCCKLHQKPSVLLANKWRENAGL